MKYKSRAAALMGAAGLCALSIADTTAQTFTWDGGTDGGGLTFSASANWVGNSLPTVGSDVVFDPASVSSPGTLGNVYLAASATSAAGGSWTFQTVTFQDVVTNMLIGANSSSAATTTRTLTLSGANAGINLTEGTTSSITFGRTSFGGPLVLALTEPYTTMNVANSAATLAMASTLSITGSSTIVKTGAGTLRMDSTSTAGLTGFVVNGGVLEFGGTSTMGPLPSSSDSDFFTLNGGTIRFTETIFSSGLSSFRGFTLGAGGGTIEVTGSSTVRVLARILESAPGATFTKTGTGTFIMDSTGTSTYSGATTVAGGTLLVDSGAILQSPQVTVNAGTTFGGSGTLNGALTVAGSLAPGMSTGTAIGTLTVNNSLILESTASTVFELGATDHDKIRGVTDLVLDGTITVTLLGYTPVAGDVFQLISWNGTITYDNFNLLTDLILPTFGDPEMSWDTSSFLTNGTIAAVPEPGTMLLLGLSAGFLLWVRKVRRVAR